MLMRLQSVIVHCSDLQRSIAFYRDQLGFPVKRQTPERAEFHCGPVTLALLLASPAPKTQQANDAPRQPSVASPPGRAQLSFEVLNLDAFYKEKKEQGVEFALAPTPPTPPTLNEFGVVLAVMLDPDGFPISVVQEIR